MSLAVLRGAKDWRATQCGLPFFGQGEGEKLVAKGC